MQTEEKKYWESFYAKNRSFDKPSPFGEFVLPFIQQNTRLLELGCGNARDTFYLSKHRDLMITALDQCENEIAYLNENKDTLKVDFVAGDFTQYVEANAFDYVYSRFTLHSVDENSEKRTLSNVQQSLKQGGLLFVEVRSTKDELYGQGTRLSEHEYITDHYRRFIVMEEMIENGKGAGLDVIYSLQSKGLAPYKTEDPEVIRIIFQKS